MTYHANHSWCNNCNWNNESFDSGAMVYFERTITKTDILQHNKNISNINEIVNPDWINLIEYKKTFDEEEYLSNMETMKKVFTKENMLDKLELIEKGEFKEAFIKKYPTLKQEVIDWLNENIKDAKYPDSDELQDIKGWCIGNTYYRSKDHGINIFFKRELDALKFIRECSVFKEPIFYFDYFSDDRRNIDLNKYIYLYNEYASNNNLELIDISKLNLNNKFQGNVNLNPLTFRLLDWEKKEIDPKTGEIYEANDIELNKTEMYNYVKTLYKTNGDDTSYDKFNCVDYPKYFELENTNKISSGYEVPKTNTQNDEINDLEIINLN